MPTLEDVLQALERMGVETYEVKISRSAYAYLIKSAQGVIIAEEEEEE